MRKLMIEEIKKDVNECYEKINWYKEYINSKPFSNAAHEAFFKYNSIYTQLTLWLDKLEE